jgi:hypothetical protein
MSMKEHGHVEFPWLCSLAMVASFRAYMQQTLEQ